MAKVSDKRIGEIREEVLRKVYGVVKRIKDGTEIIIAAVIGFALLEGEKIEEYEPPYSSFKPEEFKVFVRLLGEVEAEKAKSLSSPKREFNRNASILFALKKLEGRGTLSDLYSLSEREYIRVTGSSSKRPGEEAKFYGLKLLSALEYSGLALVDSTNKTFSVSADFLKVLSGEKFPVKESENETV